MLELQKKPPSRPRIQAFASLTSSQMPRHARLSGKCFLRPFVPLTSGKTGNFSSGVLLGLTENGPLTGAIFLSALKSVEWRDRAKGTADESTR